MPERPRLVRARPRAWFALQAGALFAWSVPLVAALAPIAAALALAVTARAAAILVMVAASFVWRGALTVVRTPRSGRPLLPGFALARDEEPALWLLADRAAAALRVAPADELRLTAESSVVAHRHDGTLTVGVGLAWLTATTADELLAALVRALAGARTGAGSLREQRFHERLARAARRSTETPLGRAWIPYLWAGERLQGWIARRQLQEADRASVAAVGQDGLTAGLRATARHRGFAAYWSRSVGTCLVEGYAPPILEGWRAVMEHDEELGAPLALREPVRTLERRLLRALLPDTAGGLVDLPWDRVATAVWLPQLRAELAAFDDGPAPFALRALATAVRSDPLDEIEGPDDFWLDVVANALAVALVDQAGWTLDGAPGGPLSVRQGDFELLPFAACSAISQPEWDADGWEAFVDAAGIGDVVVGAPAASATPIVDLPPTEQTVVPPGTAPRTVALAPPARRAASLALFVFFALLGPPGAIALMVASPKADTSGGQVSVLVFGLAILVISVVVLRAQMGVLRVKGTLTVTADTVRIDHPGLLKAPFEIPRAAVRAIIVDDGEWSDTRRFAVGPTEHLLPAGVGRGAAWLWTAGAAALVPLLGSPDRPPNVALLVDDPSLAPRVRQVTLTGPLPGEAFTGLLVAVTDAEAARAAFAPWDLTRAGRRADAAHVFDGFFGPREPSALN